MAQSNWIPFAEQLPQPSQLIAVLYSTGYVYAGKWGEHVNIKIVKKFDNSAKWFPLPNID